MSKKSAVVSSEPIPVTYASLINNKIAIMSASTPYFAVEQHFFYELMEKHLSRIFVDSDWYLQRYPDIAEAVKAGSVSDAKDHFCRFGYYEHRMPYRIDVDEAWYLGAYPDIKKGIEAGHFPTAQHHFDMLGFREGRIPFANFSLKLAG